MQCPNPISIRKPHGNTNERISVPCGNCAFCLTNRRQDWIIRLREEMKQWDDAVFVTLTYNDNMIIEAYDYETGEIRSNLSKKQVTRYIKRVRKNSGKDIKYYLVGEYGRRTKRAHYHIIFYGLSHNDYRVIVDSWNYRKKYIGNVDVIPVNIKTITYISKYHVNRGRYPNGCSPPFNLMSKGLGSSYVDRMKEFHTNIDKSFYQFFEFKKTLPRYYKNKLYNEFERELIGLKNRERVDKKELLLKEQISKETSENYYKEMQSRYEAYKSNFKEKNNKGEKL